MTEQRQGCGGARGGLISAIVLAINLSSKKMKIKYAVALDGRCSLFYTQQPTKNTWAQWRR
jgi:hypothetical protein